jgi:uncharacterized protein YcfJ
MRKFVLTMSLLAFGPGLLAVPAAAQTAPATVPVPSTVAAPATSLSSTVPTPTDPDAVDPYQIAAITVGAVGGIVVANMLTMGLASPAAAAATGAGGTVAMEAGAAYAISAGQVAISALGAVIGGYVGNWMYGN